MVAKPKRHHYLPKSYQQGFCLDGLLWVYDRENKKYQRRSPENTGVEGHFYSIENKHGEKDPTVETLLADNVDGPFKLVLEKLDHGEPINAKERETASLFVSLLFSRLPSFERTQQHVVDQLAKRVMKMRFYSVEQTRLAFERYSALTGSQPPDSPEEFFNLVQSEQYNVKIHRNQVILSMLEFGLKLASYCDQMNWVIFHAPANTSFITTDSPFTPTAPPKFRQRNPYSLFGYGILTPGSIKLLPLSQSSCLAMGDYGNSTLHQKIPLDKVRQMNLLIARNCERFIFARDERLLRNIIATTGVDRQKPHPRVKVNDR